MPFIHPLLFWLGLGGISIPILIHILNKRRFKIIEWAAMKFLLDALRKNRKRLQLEELILLLLRCLALLLLGFALARFIGCDSSASLFGSQSRTLVYLVDDSVSMGQKHGAKTLFSQMREDLKTELGKVHNGDNAMVLLTSRPDTKQALLPLGGVDDMERLEAKINTQRASDMRTRLSDSVEAISQTLLDAEGDARLMIFSDFRRNDLTDKTEATRLRDLIGKLQAEGVQVIVNDYGRKAKKNLGVESLTMLDSYVLQGRETRLKVTVRNTGSAPAINVPVELALQYWDVEKGKMKTHALPVVTFKEIGPNQSAVREVPFAAEVEGTNIVSVKLPADELPGDNEAFLSLDAQAATRVLIVDGQPSGARESDKESYFLHTALDPNRTAGYGYDVSIVTRDNLTDVEFGDYDVVCLLDLSDFPIQPVKVKDGKKDDYASVRKLEAFVRNGGGLVIFTGDHVDLEFYNTRLHDRGEGLCPVTISPRKGDPTRRGQYVRWGLKSIRAGGVLDFFTGDMSGISNGIRFFAYTVAQEPPSPETPTSPAAVVEARYNDENQSPAVVSKPFGEGRVVMFLSTASQRWNDWPLDEAISAKGLYVLYMADLIDMLRRGQDENLNGKVAETFTYDLPVLMSDFTVMFRSPKTGSELMELKPKDKGQHRKQVQVDSLRELGVYSLSLRQGSKIAKVVLAARNVDPAESDLLPGKKAELATAIGDTGWLIYIDRTLDDTDATSADRFQRNDWIWALLALLVLLGVEGYLAWRFGHWT
ncbi:MAG: hypothetical protein HN909_06365 [Phycisphaerales bacterium]|jgi:hypothetical protein|nr:hypothetical protein [Phycisphaerales bacterium]MBT7171376.1 hypothetical protein [Phycisphaerales bacterium]